MFLNRLSTALCAIMCLGGVVLGTNPDTRLNANKVGEESSLLAPLYVSIILLPHSPKCNGESNGSIEVQVVTGTGVAPYSYQLQADGGALLAPVINNPSIFYINNLSAGSYTVYITDAVGTTGFNTTTISENPILNIDLEQPITQPACSGNTADLLFEANGGNNSSYTYDLYKGSLIDNSNSNGDFFGRGAGIYSLVVTDGSGCTKSYNGTIEIKVPAVIDFSFNILSNITCEDGFAKVDFNNLPIDAFTIDVHNIDLDKHYTAHDINYVYSNLDARNYEVTVTRNSCPADFQTKTFTVEGFDPIIISTLPASPVNLSCGGSNDLTDIEITIDGGRSGLQVHVVLDNNNGIADDQEFTVAYGSTGSFANVAGGNYTIRWNDVSNSTCKGTYNYVINSPASVLSFLGTVTGGSTSCNGLSDGTIQIPVSGGQVPYAYYVNNISKPNAADFQLSAGTYTVYVEDANGCTTDEVQVTITQPDPVVANHIAANDVDVSCPGSNDGSIAVSSISGGSGTYLYDLSGTLTRTDRSIGNLSDYTISSLIAGTYSATIKDDKGCAANTLSDIIIEEPTSLLLDEITFSDAIVCYGGTTNVFVLANGGLQPVITYQLLKGGVVIDTQTGNSGVTFTSLLASAYQLKVWGDANCQTIDTTFTIASSKQIILNNFSDSIMVPCSGDEATLNLSIQGSLPFNYSLDGGSDIAFDNASSTAITGLGATLTGQTHLINITDVNSCSKQISVIVYEPEGLTNTQPTVTDVTCKGTATGKVKLQVNGGTAGYSITLGAYSQSFSTGNVLMNNIAAGTYSLQVSDKRGCTLAAPIEVIVEEPAQEFIIQDPVIVSPILCSGEQAEVEITAVGGWNVDKEINVIGQGVDLTQPSGSSFILPVGTYTITATNADGCSAVRYFDVAGPKELVLDISSFSSVSCFGADDAQITLLVSGGTPGYSYNIDGSSFIPFSGNTVKIDAGLVSKKYDIIIRDANGCTSNQESVTISEPTEVNFTVTKIDSVECNGGTSGRIILGATGGTGTYSYSLSGTVGTFQTSNIFANLTAGDYPVYVQDSNNCQARDNGNTVAVGEPDYPIVISDVQVIQGILCAGDNNAIITVDASGGQPYVGLQYKVSGTSYQTNNEISGLGDGKYTVFVSDSRGKCETAWSSEITLVDPPNLTLIDPKVINVLCNNKKNGSVSIEADGGTAPYSYYLSDETGLIEGPKIVGEFYNLGGKSTNTTIPVSTTYTVKVEDGNKCAAEYVFSITNPARLQMDEIDHHQVTCNGLGNGWVKVQVQGGTGAYSFKKDFSDVNSTTDVTSVSSNVYTINKYTGGIYMPMVLDANQCSDTVSLPIQIIDPPKLIIADVDPGVKDCNYSTNDVTTIVLDDTNIGTPGYRYSIDGGTTTQNSNVFKNARKKLITPYVIDTMGCSYTYEVMEISWPDSLIVGLTKNEIRCWDYQYGTATIDFVGGTAPYYVSVDAPLFPNPVVIEENTSAPSTTKTIGANPNKLFGWGVNHDIYVKDENGCAAENFAISESSTPIVTYKWDFVDTLKLLNIDPTRPKCAGDQGTIQYTVSGGTEPYAYWVQDKESSGSVVPTNQDDDGLVNVPTGMTLYCYISDINSCRAYVPDNPGKNYLTTYIYPINDTVSVEISILKAPYCPSTKDGRVGLEVTGFLKDGVTFYVDKLDTIYDTYREVFVDQILKEQATDSARITLPPGADTINVFEWMYSVRLDTIDYKFTAGLYGITFIDNITECDVSYQFELIPDSSDCEDIFPKVFTPNNDNKNDLWMVSQYEKSDVQLKIFTAYGELVYEFSGLVPENGLTWDGLDKNNRPVPAGTYIYVYQPDVTEDQTNLVYGTVTILRNR